MKTRIFLLVCLLVLGVGMQAQTYNQLWTNVEQMEQKDLPKSVIAEAEKIYAKAKKERNVPQMMKAYLTMMAWRGNISPDSISVDIKGLEEWASQKDTEVQDKAVLYSILGGICIRDDFEKGNHYLHLSLKDSLTLVGYPAEKLMPVVESGETSRLYFDNNLYDLLARRAIRLWEQNQWNVQQVDVRQTIRETYQSLLHIYKVKGMRSAWLLTALDAYPQADENQLREWIKEYGDLDVCAEVYLRLARWMLREDEPAKRLALLREGIDRYPHYNRINALKNEERDILKPRLNLSVEHAYPEEPMDVNIHYCNLKGLTLKLYRLDLPVESPWLSKVNAKTIAQYGTLLQEEHFSLPVTSDYRSRTEKVMVNAPKAGNYYLMAVPEGIGKIQEGALLQLTSLMLIERGVPSDRQEVVVLNRKSGHPVPHAQIAICARMSNGGYEVKEIHKADADGKVVLTGKGDQNVYWNAFTDEDKTMPIHRMHFQKVRELPSHTEEYVQLFTDRSIYRPGQDVYFSGMIYTRTDDLTHAKEGRKLTVGLWDADNREIVKLDVETDAFGTFQGIFNLPASGKLGVYRLETEKAMASIRVEEYKRPTFDVTFEAVEDAYHPGDTIRVKGVARRFSGASVQGAKVKYSVSRMMNRYWRMSGTETHRVTGECVTDAQGCFEVPVHLLPVEEGEQNRFYTYRIIADVTNLSGETQEGILELPLGSASLRIEVPNWEGETVVKEQGKNLNFAVVNWKNVPVKTEVSYRVFTVLKDTDGKMLQGKCVWQGKALSNDSFVPEGIYALPSGQYQLQASVKDEAGRTCEQTITFVLFSLKDEKLPCDATVWSYQTGMEFDSRGDAVVYFGSKEKDVYLYYDVYSEKKWIESKRIHFSDSLLKFPFEYKEEYGEGIMVSFIFAKDGQLYARYLGIKKPKPNKTLQLKWKTFRDKLQPGQQETWTLNILRPDGKPADAQLMATLYDASLDQMASHRWRFALDFPRYIPTYYWGGERMRPLYWGFSFVARPLKCNPLDYSILNLPHGLGVRTGGLMMYKANTAREESVIEMKYVPPTSSYTSADAVHEEDMMEETVLETSGKGHIRTDFAETAFFYSQLRTDANGDVSIEFTLSESLTEWKFMGLAHTKNMDYGSIVAEAVASKDFMLQPNLPRFVRVGDDVNVSASLMNLSDKDVNGVVRMEIFVPETDKALLTQKRPFALKAGETGKVSFSFEVSDKYEGLVVRMVADGDTFSDGEQRYLPVLSSKQKLTESVLLNVNGAGTYTFSLENLFNHHSKTVSRPQMWVEFTGSPIWYAIQTLKVVSLPENDNALSWASAYYANALLGHLAKVEPRITDSLKVEGLKANIEESILKMRDLQHADGAWSWFKGMDGSLYMTISITQLLARLQQMTGEWADVETEQMYQKALVYLDKQIVEEVRKMKEAEKKTRQEVEPSEWMLQYLYIKALDKNRKTPTDVTGYLVDKLAKMSGRLTIYGKALSAIILQEAGEKAEAKEFLQSVMQYSVMTPEMGRYFDSPKAHYSWFSYKIPTQVAAIEAVRRVANEEKTQEEMKQWLLKQKQAQVWETPIATTDAVYALLTTGTDWLANTGEGEIVIREGENRKREDVLKFGDGESLGYIQQKIQGNVMDVREVAVKKKSAGIGWGAVYAEFEEDMDKVQTQGNALKVTRRLHKAGKPLADGDALQVGDRLTVCLSVVADRDMDFVQVKDEHAACLEPVDALSGYRWNGHVGYYQEIKDASTLFYMDKMRKGTYELKYDVYVISSGVYRQGVPEAHSVYAPEFGGHGEGGRLMVK